MNNYGNDLGVEMEIARKQIKLSRDALEMVPAVLETIKRFDGKVANKRLETALEAVNSGFTCRRNQYGNEWEIKWYTQDRSITVKSINWRGMETCNAYYIRQSEAYFARDLFDNTYGSFTDDEGRWMVENICKQIEAEAESWKQDIEKWEEELENIDDLRDRKRKLEAEIEAHNKGISWLADEYFSLRIGR